MKEHPPRPPEPASAAWRPLGSLLRIFFALLYHQLAWTYDWVAAIVSLGLWPEWVKQVLPYLEGPNILELGHGPGHLQLAMHRRGLNAFGLDRSSQMGRQAQRRLQRAGLQARLVHGAAQSLPYANAIFQQVVATFPTEYIADPLSLAEIYRVLTPGGQTIILPLAWIRGKNAPQRLAAWLFRITGQAPDWDGRFLEPFRQAGFQVHLEWLDVKFSTLLIIRAVKPLILL